MILLSKKATFPQKRFKIFAVIYLLLLDDATNKLSSFLDLERGTVHSEGFLRSISVHTVLNHIHLTAALNCQVLDGLSTSTWWKRGF